MSVSSNNAPTKRLLGDKSNFISSLLLIGITLIAFALNLQLLNRYPLREDEALYSFWARHLHAVDPWMLTVWPDKPPLFLWCQSLALHFFGPTQAAARFLNIAITTATAPLLAATSRRLWGSSGATAALLYALSPFAISFAATAYTDPLLVFWGQLALYLVISRRPLWAGVALGAAIMTKQHGLFYLPLILMFAHLSTQTTHWYKTSTTLATRTRIKQISNLFLGITLVVLPILYWDSQRWAVAPSPWDLSVRNYGPLALAPIGSLAIRADAWRTLLWFFASTPYGWLLYFLLIVKVGVAIGSTQRRITRLRFALLTGWLLAYFGVHLITTIQIWDRYLLPLVPIFVLLLAFQPTTGKPWRPSPLTITHGLMLGAILLFAIPGAFHAASGKLPIGGDHGAFTGLTDAVAWLQQTNRTRADHLPMILYQQSLGWQLQFYLFDEIQNGEIELRWFANGVTLADNAAKDGVHARYLLQPSRQSQPLLSLHMATRKQRLVKKQSFGAFALYRIESKLDSPCSWCFCTIVNRKIEESTLRNWNINLRTGPQSRP